MARPRASMSPSGETSSRRAVPWSSFPAPCAGVDEAGRGCLAGPVVAAAAVFAPAFDFSQLPGLDDSKQVREADRLRLAGEIRRHSLAWAVGFAWPREIEAVNILQATLRAMRRAVDRLAVRPVFLVIDGNQLLPECPIAQQALVDGDALTPGIAAASILAKTTRDRVMQALDLRFPGYGFASHKGYGCAAHKAAIRALGPCLQHRMTFRGVRPEEEQARLPGL
ncbi:ribonuclease HII [Megalodesulfovibrio gigas]|uniref:ribonuclease HII n=1 Tax=Megalodesulfovibrio gigas TaxID=879 RepID=UPI0005584276